MAEHIEHHHHSVLDAFNPMHNRLNWLLAAVPITLFFEFQHNVEMTFLFSMIAIMPLAFLMGHATEEIALRAGENLGGLLNATFGNAVEIIIAGLALWTAAQHADQAEIMIQLVQASLIGSILGNLLLVLGLALLWGGYKHRTQTFNQEALSMNGSLLLLAVLALIIPAAASHTGADSNILNLSRYASLVLLLMYGLSLFFQFKTHSHLFDVTSEAEEKEEPKMTTKDAWILLILATVLVGWMAEVLVHSVDEAAEGWGLPTLFIGVILCHSLVTQQSISRLFWSQERTRWIFHLQSPSVRVFKLLSSLLHSWFSSHGRWASTFHSSLVFSKRLQRSCPFL